MKQKTWYCKRQVTSHPVLWTCLLSPQRHPAYIEVDAAQLSCVTKNITASCSCCITSHSAPSPPLTTGLNETAPSLPLSTGLNETAPSPPTSRNLNEAIARTYTWKGVNQYACDQRNSKLKMARALCYY